MQSILRVFTAVLMAGSCVMANYPPTCDTRMTHYYRELGCKPNHRPGEHCPFSYNCSDSHMSENLANQCSYNGQLYRVGSTVPSIYDSLLGCRASCTCTEDTPGHPVFTCPPQQCGSTLKPHPGCVETFHSVENCCVDKVCCQNSNSSAPRQECRDGFKKYQIGEKFSPMGFPCRVCLCGQGYSAFTSDQYCRDSYCDLQTLHRDYIRAGCAPVFHDHMTCCPTEWRCPLKYDTVIPAEPCANNTFENSIENTCFFGELQLRMRERLSQDPTGPCMDCKCDTPPQITCRRLPNAHCYTTYKQIQH